MALRNLLARKKLRDSRPAAHITWASRSMSHSVQRTREFLSQRLWAWPIIALVLLLAVGWAVRGAIERTMNANLRSQLETLRDVEVAMLRTWLTAQENNALSVACDEEIRRLTLSLLETTSQQETDRQTVVRQLTRSLRPEMNAHDYQNYFIADRETILASSRAEGIGLKPPAEFDAYYARVFDGQTTVTRPFKSLLTHVAADGQRRAGVPMMFVLAPLVDEQLQTVAVLGLQIRPEQEFTRILQLGRLGQSGETYAFDAAGLMLSNSRFNHDLVLQGLLPEGSESILNLLVRDPGGNLTAGFRPQIVRSQLPPTRMVAAAVADGTGVDVAGYRDYRGVSVVGAWTWLPAYSFGVTTEINFDEAFRPLTILQRTFGGLLVLLATSSVAIFVFTVMMARLQQQAREATIEARQLGQYKLEEKLGAGAMGVVYRGRHAMLRRPTAIKLLNVDKVTDASINLFEREVQITSHLCHPNTIAIYDYGRTPEGVFYYAMEYLDGIDLQQLVDQYGPQPAGRVIYILKQICGSLYEAHCSGLVHRDIKPANVMINHRGGEGDVVKVLDFGLVKAREGDLRDANTDSLAGTPLYMPPEAIQLPSSVDACSDLYAVGAIGYFLLTGQPVFAATELSELLQLHISTPPQPPSERLGKPVPTELEHALCSCLEKNRAKRPQTARELAKLLDACPAAATWSTDQADTWWSKHQRGQQAQPRTSTADSQPDETVLLG